MKRVFFYLCVLMFVSTEAMSQEVAAEVENAPVAENAPVSEGADVPAVSLAQKLVMMTDQIVAAVAAREGDCQAMGEAFASQLNAHKEFMASLEYATEQADESVIARVHENAQKLGTLLGACYDDESIEKHILNAMNH